MEGIAEAGHAVTGVGGVEVFAAHAEVVLEVLATAYVSDVDPVRRGAADVGAGFDSEAEDVAQDEHDTAFDGEAAEGGEQARALELRQEHVEAPDVAADQRVAEVDGDGGVGAEDLVQLAEAVDAMGLLLEHEWGDQSAQPVRRIAWVLVQDLADGGERLVARAEHVGGDDVELLEVFGGGHGGALRLRVSVKVAGVAEPGKRSPAS